MNEGWKVTAQRSSEQPKMRMENALGTGQPAPVWSGLCHRVTAMAISAEGLRPFLGSSEKAGRVRTLFPKRQPRLHRNQRYTIVIYRDPGAGEREGRVVFPLRYLH